MAVQALASACAALPLISLALLIEAVATGGALLPWVLLAAVSAPARAALDSLALTLAHHADARLQLHLRRETSQSVRRRPLADVEALSPAAVRRVVLDDVGALHHLVGHTVLDLTACVVGPLTGFVALLMLAPPLALPAVVPLVVGTLLHRRSLAQIRASMPHYIAASAALDESVVEYVEGFRVARVFGDPRQAHSGYVRAANDYGGFVRRWSASLTPRIGASQICFSAPTSVVVTVLVGAALVVAGTLDLSQVAAGALLAPTLTAPAQSLAFSLQEAAQGRHSLQRIREFLDEAPPETRTEAPAESSLRPRDEEDLIPIRRATEQVVLDGVGYSYGARQVLVDVGLTLVPGRTVGVIGRSGSGKSTLAEIVAGLREPHAGRVLIHGHDTRDLSEDQLLARAAYVPQDTRLMRGTIAENIRLASPGTDDDRIEEALRVAGLGPLLARLPDGIDTALGDGVDLSGGERQRVGIVRALLSDHDVLVLDEVTSALDEEAQERVLAAIRAQGRARSVLLVSHRISAVAQADEVLVMDEGRIVERGTPAQLDDRDGIYAHYSRLQTAVPREDAR